MGGEEERFASPVGKKEPVQNLSSGLCRPRTSANKIPSPMRHQVSVTAHASRGEMVAISPSYIPLETGSCFGGTKMRRVDILRPPGFWPVGFFQVFSLALPLYLRSLSLCERKKAPDVSQGQRRPRNERKCRSVAACFLDHRCSCPAISCSAKEGPSARAGAFEGEFARIKGSKEAVAASLSGANACLIPWIRKAEGAIERGDLIRWSLEGDVVV